MRRFHMFHGMVFFHPCIYKTKILFITVLLEAFWSRITMQISMQSFLQCLINLHPLLLSFFAPWHFSTASCVVIRADQQQQAPVILDPPSVSDRCQCSAIHLAAILLLRAHGYQKVCLIASKMDVSTPAIRGSAPLGRLMGLVMMLIRYTMIEIPLHMCVHMHVPGESTPKHSNEIKPKTPLVNSPFTQTKISLPDHQRQTQYISTAVRLSAEAREGTLQSCAASTEHQQWVRLYGGRWGMLKGTDGP